MNERFETGLSIASTLHLFSNIHRVANTGTDAAASELIVDGIPRFWRNSFFEASKTEQNCVVITCVLSHIIINNILLHWRTFLHSTSCHSDISGISRRSYIFRPSQSIHNKPIDIIFLMYSQKRKIVRWGRRLEFCFCTFLLVGAKRSLFKKKIWSKGRIILAVNRMWLLSN